MSVSKGAMNFSIYTMLVLFQFCIYFHVVVFLYIGCRFLLCRQFEWIGRFDRHSDPDLQRDNLLKMWNLCLGCKFLLNKQFEWIGLVPKMHQHSALNLHRDNLQML